MENKIEEVELSETELDAIFGGRGAGLCRCSGRTACRCEANSRCARVCLN
jgi:natural product precursor